MSRRILLRASIVVLLAFAGVDVSLAQQQLIGPEVNPADFGISTAQQAQNKRSRFVRINPQALQNSRIALSLFGDASFVTDIQSSGRQLDSDTYVGSIEGEPLGLVTISSHPSGVIFGKVETPSAIYLIQPKAGPIHEVVELDLAEIEDEGEGDGITEPGAENDAAAGKLAADSVCLPSTSCSSQVIDVMVVYTAQARTVLGGSDASAQTAIANAVAEMNAANSNSGVIHTFNLVYSDLVSYTESGNASTDLNRLANGSDGYMDIVHTWRNTYGADLVSLVTDTGGCGIGYVQSNPTSYSSGAAFSTVRDDCLTGNKTLAHEMGHNSGLHHDWFVNSSTTPCEFAHGYVNQAAFEAGSYLVATLAHDHGIQQPVPERRWI